MDLNSSSLGEVSGIQHGFSQNVAKESPFTVVPKVGN